MAVARFSVPIEVIDGVIAMKEPSEPFDTILIQHSSGERRYYASASVSDSPKSAKKRRQHRTSRRTELGLTFHCRFQQTDPQRSFQLTCGWLK